MLVISPRFVVALVIVLISRFASTDLAAGQLRSGKPQPEKSNERQAEPKQTTRLDCYGDPLPTEAIARLGTVRLRPAGGAHCVAFSPDGKLLASGGRSKLSIWEVTTGKELHRCQCQWKGPQEQVFSLAFSPDSHTLAAGSFGTVHLCEVATGKELLQWDGHGSNVETVVFSPDGKLLASGAGWGDQTIRLREIATGKELRRFPGRIVAFSPNGKLLACATWYEKALGARGGPDEKVVRLLEAATGKEVRQLQGHGKGILAVAFSPDGKTLAAGGIDRTVRLWEVDTGKEILQLKGHGPNPGPVFGEESAYRDGVTSVAFCGDSKLLASAGRDGAIRLWEVATGKELHQFPGGSVALSPDGKLLASPALRLWETATGKELQARGGHRADVKFLAFAADGKTLTSGGWDKTIRLWETASGKELRRFDQRGDWLSSGAISANGKIVAGGMWDNEARRPILRLWEAASGKELRQFGKDQEWANYLALSPDGRILATNSGGDEPTRLWETATGKELRHLPGEAGHSLMALAFSPDGKTLATAIQHAEDGNAFVKLWEVATGKELRCLPSESRYGVRALAFSPDGTVLAAGGYRSGDGKEDGEAFAIKLWAVANGKKLHEFRKVNDDRSGVFAVGFSPDGRTLATGEADGSVHLWEVATGKERFRFVGHRSEVGCLTFSVDCKFLASGSSDTTALVWDLTGRPRVDRLTSEDLQILWTDLASEDAEKAYRAILVLSATPEQAVPFLRRQLQPVAPVDSQRLQQLLDDLDNAQFALREKAARELEKLGELATPALRRVLKSDPSEEVRRRAEELLAKVEAEPLSSQQLQMLRAVEVLERLSTSEAGQVLKALAGGAREARLTREANVSLGRLADRRIIEP
jgi:WD40 repeat protein